uniref:Multiple epidermal growth factor-like domains 10 n=1 Tax=Magallana gigas TaxID=29159 RepID=A0A8W8NZB1_MAGGI
MFGKGCARRCGHCRNDTHCHHVNGSCLNGCEAGYKGNHCIDVCESGYYGLNCNQECSMFCKNSRDCHPMSGYCKEGCKNGWQGLDCLEVSTLAMNEKNWKSAFSGILSAFCISLIFNTITIAYFIVKRIRNSTAKAKQLMMLQSDISEKGRKNDVLNVYTNETTASNYQELREFKTTVTYDTPKDKKTVIE